MLSRERDADRKGAALANVFAQYLNRHGTDFSYIKSDPSFGDLSEEQLFGMYREYMSSKSIFVNKIGGESKIAKIEKIVGRSTSCGEKGASAEHAYRAQVLLDGRKRVQTVVDLQMDDFRLPFLLKDLEVHLKQQLTYIREIYGVLEKTGAINPLFLEDCAENSHNRSETAASKQDLHWEAQDTMTVPETDGAAEAGNVPEKASQCVTAMQPLKDSLPDPLSSLDGLSNVCNEENGSTISIRHADKIISSSHAQSEKEMSSMVDYPTSENAQADDNNCPSSAPDSACSKDGGEAGHPNMVLNADILTKYDDYLGDFNEDLLEMELPVPKTSIYNPLTHQGQKAEIDCSAMPADSSAEACQASIQTVQSMKRRCPSRVMVQSKEASSLPGAQQDSCGGPQA